MRLSDEDKFASIRNIILNTGNPVLIYLYHKNGSNAAHSVLAYAYDKSAGTISIYDPNHPGVTKTITYNATTKTFDAYGEFDGIVYNGDGSLHLTEAYENILEDADSNFNSSGMATISVTSHHNNQEVTERNITISGTIQSSQVLVTQPKVYVGSDSFTTNVDSITGAFAVTIV